MHVVHEQTDLEDAIARDSHPGSVFVPTMGALHAGHIALIRSAAGMEGPCVVSIFVNETQFAPGEDFDQYPRMLDADLALAESAGADIVFVPGTKLIHPDGIDAANRSASELELPLVATRPGLEDAERPHFFPGVCLVVGRLLDLVKPRACILGEKDYQQLLVLSAFVGRDPGRFGQIEIIGAPTVRDEDGLALSSRNTYLDDGTRARALGIHAALESATGCSTPAEAEACMLDILEHHDLEVGYAVVRDAATLEPCRDPDAPVGHGRSGMRCLVAARAGGIRLIDNRPF